MSKNSHVSLPETPLAIRLTSAGPLRIAVGFTDSIAKSLGIPVANVEPVAQQLLFYFIAIVVLGIIVLVARRLDNSPIGRAWTAIREDEIAAIAMGVRWCG